MSLCLVAIFKNEGHIIREWIEHYINQGVDKFFLIDNGSNDNYLEKIKSFIDNNIVELVIDNEKYAQTKLYNKYYLDKCKLYDWVIVCDLDEFIYSRMGIKTIKEYLSKLNDNISQVYIPWKLFGSNNHIQQPENIIHSFTKRRSYRIIDNDDFQGGGINTNQYNKFSYTKCIVRTKYLIKFKIHNHETTNQNYITTNRKTVIHNTNYMCKISERILENSYLHLNHYAIQSRNWFMNVKKTRGDVSTNISDNVRDEKYFNDYDKGSSNIDDFELRNITIIKKNSNL
jgi:hypothetical protein